jgi:hypothetical protein
MKKNTNQSAGFTIFEVMVVAQFLLVIAMGISWIVNLVKLVNCDFVAPWRDEIIHLVGLIPPAALVTAWM